MKRVIILLTAAFAAVVFGMQWFQASQDRPAPEKKWSERHQITEPVGNLYVDTKWAPEAGAFLRFTDPEQQRDLILQLHAENSGVWAEPASAFPPFFSDSVKFYPQSLPDQALDHAEITVKIRKADWLIYLENKLIVRMPAPWTPPATLLQEQAEIPETPEEEPFFQRIAAFEFHDAFLVPEGEENQLSAWDKVVGEWDLHTAADNAVERQNIAAAADNKPQPARSPNFYSLRGKGKHARLLTGHYFYDSYSVEVAVGARKGENGLVFYAQEDGSFHAFTLRLGESANALLQLWRRAGDDEDSPREVLQTVTTKLTEGQWIKLRVVAQHDRVRCYLDQTLVIDAALSLPVGGPFGLYADSEQGVRFDDVSAATVDDLELKTKTAVKFYTLRAKGRFFEGQRKLLGLLNKNDDDDRLLRVSPESGNRHIEIGSPQHGPHFFSARFRPAKSQYTVGLLAGIRNDHEAYYRFTCDQTDAALVYTLEEVRQNSSSVLEEFRLNHAPTTGKERPNVLLAMDASQGEGKELRLYHDGALMLIHHFAEPVTGASGLLVGSRTGATIDDLSYVFKRTDLHHNQYEKNRIFVTDPFMRHWSSPEGAWITLPDETTWYKGDFFGRFLVRLPGIPGSEVHLGVPENSETGEYILKTTESELVLYAAGDAAEGEAKPLRQVTLGELDNFDGATNQSADIAAEAGDAAAVDQDEQPPSMWYSVHYEGHSMYLTSGNKVRWKISLPKPLSGRRIRLAGFSTEQLTHSFVQRYNVKDFLFTESLHEWTINGGSWEVINRFQCQPRWSHMNGESKEGLAALWAKYRFKGDFCVEMYAGMRHGWYNRPGDLNMTIMNGTTTPSQGYTVTTTGWDVNHSQLWTKLYRNGEVIQKTDKYTVPRVRAGSKRRGYNPLVHAGRDVHGAWYYIKLRKIGNRLEYYFDNELAFTVEDPEPLEDGAFGIWTFMNSMMVARVKIAAQGIEPRQAAYQPVPAVKQAERLLAADSLADEEASDVLKDGVALGAVASDLWRVDNPVGHAELNWHTSDGRGPYFSVTNLLGGGRMLAEAHMPPVKFRDLAGWRFRMKATSRAGFNFHYRVGPLDAEGNVQPVVSQFHQLTGADFSRGSHQLSGRSAVQTVPASDADWHRQGEWQRIDVWLPQELMRAYYDRTDIYVQVIGFGNLQPSNVLQGLTGNGPGEGYAVSDFSEVRYGRPAFAVRGEQTPKGFALQVRNAAKRQDQRQLATLEDLQHQLEKLTGPGLYEAWLTVNDNGVPRRHDVAWIELPDQLALAYSWSDHQPATIIVQNEADYPDPRFAKATLTSQGQALESEDVGVGAKHLLLPRTAGFTLDGNTEVTVDVNAAGNSSSFSLPWDANDVNEPPVLIGLTGPTPLFETFESGVPSPQFPALPIQVAAPRRDIPRNRFAQADNRGKAARLRIPMQATFSLAAHPVYCMKYRTGDMGRVSLAVKGNAIAAFSEKLPQAIATRHAPEPSLDGTWHSWLGIVSDAVQREPFTPHVFRSNSLAIGSYANPDQTGLFSVFDIDNVAFGPAVETAEQLAFTAEFFDRQGVRDILYAVHSGPECYEALAKQQRRALAWQTAADPKRVVPQLDGLTDGVGHLFVKAVDVRGVESEVYGLPFLLDRREPVAGHQFTETSDITANGTLLQVNIASHGGAPVEPLKLSVNWNGQSVPVSPAFSSFQHTPEADILHLNWPHIFRKQLDTTADGQTHTVTISGIVDGAGNVGADLSVPIRIDYSQDKTPPTLLAMKWPENVLFHAAWEVPGHAAAELSVPQNQPVKVIQNPKQEGFLRLHTLHANGQAWRDFDAKNAWDAASFPYIAFRMRRPQLKKDDKVKIDLEVTCNDGATYLFPLTGERTEKNVLPLKSQPTWDKTEWAPIQIDVAGAIKQYRKEQELEKLMNDTDAARRNQLLAELEKKMQTLTIKRFRFVVSEASHNYPVDIKDLFVFGPWQNDHLVTVEAYDASGIGGVQIAVAEKKAQDSISFSPVKYASSDWIEAHVLDKPGNASYPISIPIGPAQQ